jgi:hypothetical protein
LLKYLTLLKDLTTVVTAGAANLGQSSRGHSGVNTSSYVVITLPEVLVRPLVVLQHWWFLFIACGGFTHEVHIVSSL